MPLLGPPEHHSGVPERTLSLVGNKQQLDTATELIKELLSEVHLKYRVYVMLFTQLSISNVIQLLTPHVGFGMI